MKNKLTSILIGLITSVNLFAQNNVVQSEPMADQLRADGKIWVVVAVITVIFAGIILYLWRMDKKVSTLEKQHVRK